MISSLILPGVLTLLRVAAFVAFLPPFSGAHLPRTIKIGIAMSLTAFWLPQTVTVADLGFIQSGTSASPQEIADPVTAETAVSSSGFRHWMSWGYLGIRETLLGASLGWMLGMILMPLRITGSWVADQLGLNMASVTAGVENGASNIVAMLVETIGVLMLFSLSVHHNFLRVLGRTFDDYAVGAHWEFPGVGHFITLLNGLPERGLAIAAPLTVVSGLVIVALLYVMKQSPQFNWFGFGMTLRLGVGLVTLLFVFPGIVANTVRHFDWFFQ